MNIETAAVRPPDTSKCGHMLAHYLPEDCFCHGRAPTGQRFAYVMPQHTASRSIVSLLYHDLGQETCYHTHHVPNAKLLACLNITFVFSFVAHPYRRVLSGAIA